MNFTVIFSWCSGVCFYSFEDKTRVTNKLPDKLHQDCGHEAKDPVPNVVCSPDEVEDQTEDEETEGVWVQHVLGTPWSVPLLDKQRPPGSLVPCHDVCGDRERRGWVKKKRGAGNGAGGGKDGAGAVRKTEMQYLYFNCSWKWPVSASGGQS